MERSRKIFLEISSASRKVIATANEHAKRRGSPCVSRSHFQLEAHLQRISAACDTLAGILGFSLSDGTALDIRLQDWLSSDEPRVCLDTLSGIETILQSDAYVMPSWMNLFMGGWCTSSTQDKTKEAVDLLVSCKDCFHFLFAFETWSNEGGLQQEDASQFPECAPEESDSFTQMLSVVVPANIDITDPETSIPRRKDTVPEEERKLIDDMKAKKEENAWKLEEILRWLDGMNCAEKQDVIFSLRQPDTCKWLFNTEQYKAWKNGQNPFLWLHGKPGAGKSVLASAVINSLENVQQKGGVLAFFYCDFRDESSTSAAEVLRSILSKLLQSLKNSDFDPKDLVDSDLRFAIERVAATENLIDNLALAKERGGATRKNTKELARFAHHTARLLHKRPLVVVDALDECKDVEALLEGLNVLKGDVQLLATSRPLQVIKDSFLGVQFISMDSDDMAKKLSEDIMLHVTRELDARRRLRVLGDEIKEEIRSVLRRKADGMFRWIQCSIDTLNRCVTLKEVQAALNNLPEGLDEMYKRILLAIDIKTREGRLAVRALVWLVAALRPLHINELMEGLSIDLEKRTLDSSIRPMHRAALLDACGSLVAYNEMTGIVILSHFSVKEYLMNDCIRVELPQYHMKWEHAHLQLVQACMCYISNFLKRSQGSDESSDHGVSSECGSSIHSVRLHPLLHYAIREAFDHLQYLGSQIASILRDIRLLEEDIEQNSSLWDNYLSDPFTLPTWPVLTSCWPSRTHDLALYVLIAFAPNTLLRAHLPRKPPFSPKKDANPLIYAAHFNKLEHARTLLLRGAKLNSRGWRMDGRSRALPIEVAMSLGRYDMVALFILEGSTFSPQIFADLFLGRYADLVPSSVKRMLLQTDYFAEAVHDSLNNTELLSPCSCTSLLARASDTVNGQDLVRIARRLIQVVPQRGHASVPRYFDSFLHTVLEHHSEEDILEVVNLLASHTFNLLQANTHRKTPLDIAVKRAHVSVVQLFISLGARPPPDVLFVVLDLWSAKLGTQRAAQAILFRSLVENGADVCVHTDAGDSVLHIALDSLHEDEALDAVKLLVDYGCDPLETNSSGRTPLYIAISWARVSVAQHLLSLGVRLPPNIFLTLGPHGIWSTAEMVSLLVENGADPHACNADTGDSVLHIVLNQFRQEDAILEIVTFLVSCCSCDPLKVNSLGQTSFHIIIERGYMSIARHLLSLGVPLPPDILLTLGSNDIWRNVQVVCFLIENGADVHARNGVGDSVLHAMLNSARGLYEEEETVELLVAYGCDPFGANSFGKMPIHIAVEHRLYFIERYFRSLGACSPDEVQHIHQGRLVRDSDQDSISSQSSMVSVYYDALS